MEPVKSTWKTYGQITLKIGAGFFAPAFVCLILWYALKVLAFSILALVLGINGAMWLVLGIVFTAFASNELRKLDSLRKDGLSYNAEIRRVKHNIRWIRIGSLLSGYAECCYKNQENKTCLVKSTPFILERGLFFQAGHQPEYSAAVYVDSRNPRKYSIEIRVADKTKDQYDFDYR